MTNNEQDQDHAGTRVAGAATEPHISPDATAPAAATASAPEDSALTQDPLAAEPEKKTATGPQKPQDETTTAPGHAETLSQVRSPTPDHADEKITSATDLHSKATAGGRAIINQRETIPTTGKRIPTTKWEYITFCIFCKQVKHPVLLVKY